MFSMIHADLHPGNVLIGRGSLAVIDFDDAAFGWHMYDLAVALVFYERNHGFTGLRDALVEGYRGVRALSDEALRLLPMFLLIRRMVQLGWLHQRPEIAAPPSLTAGKNDICARAAAFEPPC
jgi:Ser/Thr protein kinase RdoA (MazF antagonist)